MTKTLTQLPRQVLVCIFGLLAVVSICQLAPISAATTENPSWVNPSDLTIKQLGTAPSNGLGRIAFEDNLDCQTASYTLNGSDQTTVGCFVDTSYGGLDIRNGLVTFNGNETTAVPLRGFGNRDILLPRPGSPSALAAIPTGDRGVFLGLYSNVIGMTQDEKNLLGKVIAKQIKSPADTILKDAGGTRIVANFNSLTFSENGKWLIAEGYDGRFMRINLLTQSIMPFAESLATGGAGYDQSQVAVTADGRYIAVANHAARSFRVYDLKNCSSAVCPSHEYWPALVEQAAGFRHPVHLRFLHNNLLSFIDTLGSNETTYLLTPSSNLTSFTNYLALGDSYTSGEGAFAYLPDTDTEINGCHKSTRSYPALLTADLFTLSSGHSVACSGAVINDLIDNTSYVGQVRNGIAFTDRPEAEVEQIYANFTSGYIPQLEFIKRHQPLVTTVSVSGNDIGFGNFIKLCAAPHFSRHITAANSCYQTYEDRLELAETIEQQLPRLTNLFKKVQSAAPASTVYVIGYPLLAVDNGNCALNVHLNTSEIALSIEIITNLNNVIARAATEAKVSYVDIEQALAGHRMCETVSSQVAVNGVTAGGDGGISTTVLGHEIDIDIFGKESYHPNAFGYQLIELAILRATDRLKLKPPAKNPKPAATTPSGKLLQAPKTGRAVASKKPAKITPSKIVKKGSAIAVKLKGAAKGLKPETNYAVKVKQGSVVKQVGVITSDNLSDIDGTVVLPPNLGPGTHEISVEGPDQLDDPTSITDVITIIDNEVDIDNDGILNPVDSCPGINNSGVDADRDGIDDGCDSVIGGPPAQPAGTPTVSDSPPAGTPSTGISTTTNPTPVSQIQSSSPNAQGSAVASSIDTIKLSGQVLSSSIQTSAVQGSVIQATTTKVQPASSPSLSNVSLLKSNSATSVPSVAGSRPSKNQTPLKTISWLIYLSIYLVALMLLRIAIQVLKNTA